MTKAEEADVQNMEARVNVGNAVTAKQREWSRVCTEDSDLSAYA